MFTEIHLENYRTFSDLTVDLTKKNGMPKKLILLYGENGAGKSNFASAFFTLAETMRTMEIRDLLQNIITQNRLIAENKNLLNMFRSQLRDTEAIIQDARTIGTQGNLVLDFSFLIDGKKGRYILEMDEKEIVHEKLEYTLEKNRGLYFDITPSSRRLNEKVFVDKVFLLDVQENLSKFWGKHSLLAILQYEAKDKVQTFLEAAISPQFRNCLEQLLNISCKVKCPSAPEREFIGLTHPILNRLTSGEIRSDRAHELECAELMLSRILTQVNGDIHSVYYRRNQKENSISYELYTKQMISGTLCDVPFRLESTGTQSLIDLLPFFLAAVSGNVVVVDELDAGIHDMCIRDLLLSLYQETEGQMIITTHNTLLMDSDLPAHVFYTINRQDNGIRHISCITDTVDRVHPNHNIQNRYLSGDYSGIPQKMNISLKTLFETLNQDD